MVQKKKVMSSTIVLWFSRQRNYLILFAVSHCWVSLIADLQPTMDVRLEVDALALPSQSFTVLTAECFGS